MLSLSDLVDKVYANRGDWMRYEMNRFKIVIKNDRDQEFSIKENIEIDFERQVIKLEAV